MDCPYTEPWRDAVTLKGIGHGDNGLCDVPALVNRMKGIWKTPDLTWKEQAKVKRRLIAPIGDFAKGWHQEQRPSVLMEELANQCRALRKYIQDALIAKRFMHRTVVPEHFHRIFGTDDDERDTRPVMRYPRGPRQLTFAPSGMLQLVKEWE